MSILMIVLEIILGLVFVAAGGAKLAGSKSLKSEFKRYGYPQWFMYLTGILEVTGAIGMFVGVFAPVWGVPGRLVARVHHSGRCSNPDPGQRPGEEHGAGGVAVRAGPGCERRLLLLVARRYYEERKEVQMIDFVSALATACFAFATGIFVALSFLEKPVWPLMFKSSNPKVKDEDSRLIHAALKRVIHLLPPTMIATMGSGTVLVMIQAWMLGFNWQATTTLVLLALTLGYAVSQLGGRIQAVEKVPSDGDIVIVRTGLGRLAALHHIGLAIALGMVVLQLLLVIGP